MAVVGAGGVGLNAVQGAALAGAGRIVAVDVQRGEARGGAAPSARPTGSSPGRGRGGGDPRADRRAGGRLRLRHGGRAGGDRRGGGVSRGGRARWWWWGCRASGTVVGYDPTTLAAMNQRDPRLAHGADGAGARHPLADRALAGRAAEARRAGLRALSGSRRSTPRIAATRSGAARRNVIVFGEVKLRDLEVLVVGNPPPGFGGRYFIFVKVTTDDGIIGWGEVYAATVGPEAMRAVIADVFARHMAGESPENVELMFRRAYSAGFSQRPDPTVMGAFSGLEIACWDILGKARGRPVHALWGGRLRDRLRSYTYLYPGPGEDPAAFYNDPDASAACARAHGGGGLHGGEVRSGRRPTPSTAGTSRRCRTSTGRRRSAGAIRAAVGDRADLIFGTHGQFTPVGRDPAGAADRALRPALVRGAGAAGRAARPRPGGGGVAGADRLRRAADDQGRVRDAAARRRGRGAAAEPRAGRRAARGAQGRGAGRGLRGAGGAAPLRRADRLGGGDPARRCRSRTSSSSRRSAPAAASTPSC